MEGSESPEGSSNNGRNNYLGVNKIHSAKITKVLKRSVIQAPKHQAPVYTIDKNDFRNIVQRLTGSSAESTAAAAAAAAAAPPPQPASSAPPNPALVPSPPPPRLQRVRPPPLESVFSFNKLVSNPNLADMNSASFPSHYQQQQLAVATNAAATFAPNFAASAAVTRPMPSSGPSPQFYPLQAPSSAAWANATPANPMPAVPRMTVPSGFPAPFHNSVDAAAAAAMSPQQAAFFGASPPFSPLFLVSAQQQQFPYVPPLPSPGSQYALSQLFGGSQVPFPPGSLLPLSPSAWQFHFGQLPPPSPLSPAPQFPFTSF